MSTGASRSVIVAGLALAAACGGQRREADVREARDPATASAVQAAAASGPAGIVADVRSDAVAESSSPAGYVFSANHLWFVADDGAAGRELWRTDGTPAGTVLVRDVFPGAASSGASSVTPFAGGVLFAADDGARGSELWRATVLGAALVKDLQPGSRASSPHGFAVAGGVAYFAAETAAYGIELWRTDGTEGGTALVADVLPGPAGSEPTSIAALGTTIYFAARSAADGVVLWRTTGGAPEIVSSSTGAKISTPAQLVPVGGRLYFVAPAGPGLPLQLWSTDGSQLSTKPVGPIAGNPADPSLLTPFGTALFYKAQRGGVSNLFSTDGQAQTQRTGGALGPDLEPFELFATASRLYVSGATAATGRELFAFNGVNVALVKDLEPGAASSSPAELAEVNGTVLFSARAFGIPRLWQSDGTPAGTVAVVGNGAGGIAVGELAALGPQAIFTGDDGASGLEPWVANVPLPGQVNVPSAPLRDVHANRSSSHPLALTPFGGRLFFSADIGTDPLDGTFIGRELWSTDGTAAGTALAWDVWFLSDARVAGLVDGGDVTACGPGPFPPMCGVGLLLTGFDELNGRELWRWDGRPAATPVRDISPGGLSSAPQQLTRLGAGVLFTADDGVDGVELWRTDGTSGGTAPVTDLRPGDSSFPSDLTAVNGLLYFRATANGVDFLPYQSDGTEAGTFSIELFPGGFDEPILAPAGFAPLGGDVLFSATSGVLADLGRELFRYRPGATSTARGTTSLVRDIGPGAASSDPTRVVASGGAGYFGARDGTSVGLWRTDGTQTGTALVRRLGTLGGGSVGDAVSLELGGVPRLFFVGDDEQNGPELWTSDGTAGGTAIVRDAFPGAIGSAAGSVLFPLPTRGHVLYAASDGTSGRELWISNGTPLGTRLLQDLRPGPESSNPGDFVAIGERVYFTADDGAAGRELWALDVSAAALDLTPPAPQCLPVTREAEGPNGANATFSVAATDDVSDPAAIALAYDPAPGTLFPLGATAVVATAVDEAGNVAQCTFDLAVVDTTPPAMTCPNPPPFEATSAAGAAASYADVRAVDLVSGDVTATYTLPPGSLFALGDTVVTATGADVAGNSASCDFTVTVQDTTGPVLSCPAAVVVNATGLSGAVVAYPAEATATDLVTDPGGIALEYLPPTGSTFAVGTASVVVTGRDEAGNEGRCAFDVTVVDATPPTIACPAAVTAEASSPAGAAVEWAPATATDLETASPAIAYSSAPGATFAIGTTVVTATATDLGGNQASCTFAVHVVDTTPPAVSCAGLDSVAEATGPEGAAVTYPAALASDVATADVPVVYRTDVGGALVPAPPPGGTFPLGTTTVLATATDLAGLDASCTFTVSVLDTTPPVLELPVPIFAEAESASGAVVTFEVSASDLVDPTPFVITTRPSGAVFPLGVTAVSVTARDDSGNFASRAFTITVQDTTPPALECPAPAGAEATGPDGAAVSFGAAAATDAVTADLAVSYSADSGSTFAVGETTVTASATDAAQNTGRCTFAIAVVDTTPPAIGCPAALAVEAPGPVAVELPAATASDVVTASPAVTTSVPSGSVFAGGTTVVTYTARDAAGNAASCTVDVTVTIVAAEDSGGGCGCGSGSGGGSLTLGAVLVALLRRRLRRVPAAGGAPS